jgi:hypothetical protein
MVDEVSISRVPAVTIGVEPALIRGYEDQGLIYFTWADTPVVGAQCANCHAIVWADQRSNAILSEATPSGVPTSGPGYRAYAEDKIRRFLGSLPSCPHCGQRHFDRFVNNVNYPRFANGGVLRENIARVDVIPVSAEDVEVWVLR